LNEFENGTACAMIGALPHAWPYKVLVSAPIASAAALSLA
jgi:hypothetical protein